MKSLALLSLAVLIGVVTCMSLQEFPDEERTSPNVGWFHIHFHFLEDEPEKSNEVSCDDQSCRMCTDSDFKMHVKEDAAISEISAPFKGCIEVSKADQGFNVQFQTEDTPLFTQNFGINDVPELPCVRSEMYPESAELCPMFYQGERSMCAKVEKHIQVGNTKLMNTVELGCFP